jgi:CheY-like chemotaxis protein
MTIKVLIADDQALVRMGFREILESEPDLEVVGGAGDGGEAVEASLLLRPDVVVIDIRMPRLDGVEATRLLAGKTRVLFLTTFDLNEYVYEAALRAGASGFLLQGRSCRPVRHGDPGPRRGRGAPRPVRPRGASSRSFARTPPRIPGRQQSRRSARASSRCFSSWREGPRTPRSPLELYVGDSTVKTHVSRILQKLTLRDRVQAVVLAYESGLLQPGDLRASEVR